MKTAMKARDNQRRDAIRLLLSELKNAQIDKGSALEEAEEIQFLTQQAKRRKESIEAYEAAARLDLSEKEKYELSVIEQYLPKPLSPSEAEQIIRDIIAEIGATSRKQFGQIMRLAVPKLQGRFPNAELKIMIEKILP
jgi:hypothetical protein